MNWGVKCAAAAADARVGRDAQKMQGVEVGIDTGLEGRPGKERAGVVGTGQERGGQDGNRHDQAGLPGVKGNLRDPGRVTLPPRHYPPLSHAVDADKIIFPASCYVAPVGAPAHTADSTKVALHRHQVSEENGDHVVVVASSKTLVVPSLLAVAKCLPSGDTAMAYSPSLETYRGVAGPLCGPDDRAFIAKLLLLPLTSFPCKRSPHVKHSVCMIAKSGDLAHCTSGRQCFSLASSTDGQVATRRQGAVPSPVPNPTKTS
ncbi:MAG: hypothetical protein FRX49_07734 [Trebouxia sp. A1-2]|nr:MAG: hypothetical protein FRX49_07734 [Trebouxia sp. A1-2]